MRKAYLQLHLAILIWGFTAILGKLILLDEGLLVWYRMGISSISTLLFVLISKSSLRITKQDIIQLAGISFLITLHWITFYGAIKASNVSIAISCFSSIALFTALINPIINKVKIKPRISGQQAQAIHHALEQRFHTAEIGKPQR